jgi:hypothetical protein
MKALRKRFLVVLTVVMSILSLIGGIIVYKIVPTEIFGWYVGIPLFYYGMGLAFGEVLRRINKETNTKLLNIYLILKVSKIIFTVILMLLYIVLIDEYDRVFVITIGLYYMAYLILESKFYFDFEKSLKRKKTNEKLKV